MRPLADVRRPPRRIPRPTDLAIDLPIPPKTHTTVSRICEMFRDRLGLVPETGRERFLEFHRWEITPSGSPTASRCTPVGENAGWRRGLPPSHGILAGTLPHISDFGGRTPPGHWPGYSNGPHSDAENRRFRADDGALRRLWWQEKWGQVQLVTDRRLQGTILLVRLKIQL